MVDEWIKLNDYCRGKYSQIIFNNGGGHCWIDIEITNKANDFNPNNWDIFGEDKDPHTVKRQTIDIGNFMKIVDQIPVKIKESLNTNSTGK